MVFKFAFQMQLVPLLLGGFFIMYWLQRTPWLIAVLCNSYWLPQIAWNAYNGNKKPLLPLYVLGTSAIRLLVPLYIFGRVVTPGCQIGYMEHTGCHQFECVLTAK
jgi:hypothetical protein